MCAAAPGCLQQPFTPLPSFYAHILKQQSAVITLEFIRKWSLWSKGCVQGSESLPAQPSLRQQQGFPLPGLSTASRGLCDTQKLFAAVIWEPSPARMSHSLIPRQAGFQQSLFRALCLTCLHPALQASAISREPKHPCHPGGDTKPQG